MENGDAKGTERKPKSGLKSLLSWFGKQTSENDSEESEKTGANERELLQEKPQAPQTSSPSAAPTSARMKTGRTNNLEMLRRKMLGQSTSNMQSFPALYSSFTFQNVEPDAACMKFIDQQQKEAGEVLADMTPPPIPKNPDAPPPLPTIRNASCAVGISNDRLYAWAFLFPPVNGGAALTEAEIQQEIAKQGIVYGIDNEMVKNLAQRRTYLQAAVVATGTPAIDGIDGEVIDHVERQHDIKATQREDGSVDYRNLNWVHHIKEGDIICDVIQPTDAVPGTDVKGKVLKGRNGARPKIPMGKNTAMNDDDSALIATVDGHVSFIDGRFTVVNMLMISGNVDNSVGNIDMLGDVLIKGDVLDRFIIKATGNVVVQGILEGATIISGGNIQICNGMNGNGHGMLDAKGDITCKFLENCTVQCGGKLFSESLINSSVTADDLIDVTSGRGVIIGGTIMACNSVEAKIIGSRANRTTTIVIGTTPRLLLEKDQLLSEIERLTKDREELQKNLQYLERTSGSNAQQMGLYNQMKLKLSVSRMQLSKAEKKLEELEAQRQDVSKCFIKANEIYPITNVTVGMESSSISNVTKMCRIHCDSHGDLQFY